MVLVEVPAKNGSEWVDLDTGALYGVVPSGVGCYCATRVTTDSGFLSRRLSPDFPAREGAQAYLDDLVSMLAFRLHQPVLYAGMIAGGEPTGNAGGTHAD